MNFTWSNGRQLSAITKGTDNISYTYDTEGIRTSKTVNGVTTTYSYLNGVLYSQTTGTDTMYFLYDEKGMAYGFIYNGDTYYYSRNIQGDVVYICDDYGYVASYTYDAWGNVVNISGMREAHIALANANPIRYRGYYYDTETGFYYLQSRYYDPETGRFISADGQLAAGSDLTGLNLFAYCGNNPVNRKDPNGQWWITALIVTVVVTVVATVGYNHISKRNFKQNSKADNNPTSTTKNKIINDQNSTTGNNFAYGNYSANHNACETIAVHNAKVLMGKESTLSETIKDFQSAGAMIGYGYFGSNPYAIGSVLKNSGIEYNRVGLNDMTESGTYIISFWNDNAPWNGLHTVAISYDGTIYTAYNLYGNGSEYNISLSDYAHSFICGYHVR